MLHSPRDFPGSGVLTVTLYIPSLLPPAYDADARLPVVERLLSRARLERSSCASTDAWLAQAFGMQRQQDWPVAPVALKGEGLDPGTSYWLLADPVHLSVRQANVVLVSAAELDIKAEEAQALVDALNREFSADGFEFRAPHPQRWYLKLPATPDLRTVDLENAVGRDVNRLLPQGNDQARYRRMVNEAQMLLHAHPVNQSREEKGHPQVNSLWLWGGGGLAPVHAHWAMAIGDGPLLQGLATLAGIAWTAGGGPDDLPAAGDVLVVLPADSASTWEDHVRRVEGEWLVPLSRRLRNGGIHHIDIVTVAGDEAWRWTISRADLWKFWQKARSLRAISGTALQ